jgi:hypothetical protein
MRPRLLLVAAAVLFWPLSAFAQAEAEQPTPYAVTPPPAFQQALDAGTRSADGSPGSAYWTNRADYELRATLHPDTKMLRGSATVRYHNRSPDELRRVFVHLRQNIYKAGVVRNREVDLTGGVQLQSVRHEGEPLAEQSEGDAPGYRVDGTIMRITLPEVLAPGAETTLSFEWQFEIPEAPNFRMGHNGEVFFLGYWYPQVAVYDDVHGWAAEPYQGDGEFYMPYGNYDVSITAPQGYLVGATGVLQNEAAVLSPGARRRLRRARKAGGEVVSVVNENQRGTVDGDSLTWRFRADGVRDFAFGASGEYVWKASTAQTGGNEPVLTQSLYRPDAAHWDSSATFVQEATKYLSDLVIPYPYPEMTVVEGSRILGGGMEYPMLTVIGSARGPRSLFGTTLHETSHMWFPMLVGSNEKHFAWMDEGPATYNTHRAMVERYGANPWAPGESYYYRVAGTTDEEPPMRHADQYRFGSPSRYVASYNKPALVLHALRGLLGAETFDEAYRTYARRWTEKHPYPYDFFNTFEAAAGRDLDWFWKSLLYETWTLDQAITSVETTGDAVVVTVTNEGHTPMPAPVRVTYADGATETQTVPARRWMDGAQQATLHFPAGEPERLVIDPEHFYPDVDHSDNTRAP